MIWNDALVNNELVGTPVPPVKSCSFVWESVTNGGVVEKYRMSKNTASHSSVQYSTLYCTVLYSTVLLVLCSTCTSMIDYSTKYHMTFCTKPDSKFC